ncbi:CelD/BcsL family acetyltransferase involved in cellulose biosynthesis [Shinella sp. BE166]|uniref:GNAT family N-acetyltransferase n=1 Tax=Shinella sp. BE166 TaxID=3373918 RepID=UPI003EBB61FA
MLESRIFEGMANFLQLEEDWNRLSRSVITCHLTQTFEWCRLGWETRNASPDDRLLCATVWENDRLVAVWPFLVKTSGFVARMAPVGCPMQEEYGDPLIASDVDPERVCEYLLELVRKSADVLYVYCARQGSPMQKLLSRAGMFNIPRPMDAYSVKKVGAQSFEEFMQGHSANFRNNLKQKRKRLEKLGALRFELPEDAGTSAETVNWVLAEKKKWVQRQQKECPWIYQNETSDFFLAASMLRGELGRFGLFRLTLDGKPIAAYLATIDRTRTEMLVTSFDPAYSQFSPGMLLIEDVVRWSYDHGLNFDMRPLWLGYKERWANCTTPVITYRVPLTWKGGIRLLPAYIDFTFKSFVRLVLKPEQRNAVKQALNWPFELKARIKSHLTQNSAKLAAEE